MPPRSRRPHIAFFRFYAELNDFLPAMDRGRELSHAFEGSPSVKDAIEAQGVPHTEVDLILVDSQPVGFGHHLRDGERVSVYPVFESFDLAGIGLLREEPLRKPRFVVDVNLGRLARWLRLLGFDVLYGNDQTDAQVVAGSVRERRVVLTRDRVLLHHQALTHGYWLRSDDPQAQVVEVLRRFQLERHLQPFSRCLDCNGRIVAVAKEEILDRLEPRTRTHFTDFSRCESCGRIYWRGSHYERMLAKIQRLVSDEGRESRTRLPDACR